MAQTAMQELIEHLRNDLQSCKPFAPAIPYIASAIVKAESLLEKEKQQIISARMESMTDGELSYQNAEQYYEQKYGGRYIK